VGVVNHLLSLVKLTRPHHV